MGIVRGSGSVPYARDNLQNMDSFFQADFFISVCVRIRAGPCLIHAGCHFQCNKEVCQVCVSVLIQIADFVFGYDFRADAFIRQFV